MTNGKTDRERIEKLSMFSIDLTQKIRSLIDVLGPYAPLAQALTEHPNALIVKVEVKFQGTKQCLYRLLFKSGAVQEIYVLQNDVYHYIANRFNKALFGTNDIVKASISVDGVTIDPA